jgi:hypothetical protein
MNPLVVAGLFTAFTVLVCHTALGYWFRSSRFARQQAIYRTLIARRWVRESIPQTLPITALSGMFLTLAAWGRALLAAEPNLPTRPVLYASAICLVLAFLTLVGFVPPLLLYNAPAFLVPPHDRGRPGGLVLRRRYGAR